MLPALPRSTGDGPVAGPPFIARMWLESTAAREKSSRSAARSSESSSSCRCCQTPASFQARSRRQQVIPRAEAQLLGQILPAAPGVQHLATIQTLTTWTPRITRDDRQQRLDARPQSVVDLPRSGSGLPRLDWLAPPSASINEN